MTRGHKSDRVEHINARLDAGALDDRVVLRLSRTSLKAKPPVVQFVNRVYAGPQRSLWPA